jgi:carbonic anhydrase
MRQLREGNERFVSQRATSGHRDAARRDEVAKGQHPFAVVLGCADSRVPPEVVFDQGLGDLFVIRVAGEVAPAEVIGSIEYAVEHLGCRTVIVLGHERCGAVEAALSGPAPEGNLGELIKDILPAIEQIDRKAPDALHAAVLANARAVARTIVGRSKVLGEMAHKGDVRVTPARYDLDTGKVEFMEAAGAPR